MALTTPLLGGCAGFAGETLPPRPGEVGRVLNTLLPTSALLLGEQHDAPEHHALQLAVVQDLSANGRLAALVLEMAEQGMPVQPMPASASDVEVQAAMGWSASWPWASYGPVVMAAVRAGVPVLGGNLPRSRMHQAMGDTGLEATLAAEALALQREQIRVGHCDLLPATQIGPMTRVQIARDQTMAQTLVQAADRYRRPGQLVLLIAGNGHVRRDLGVPLFLPRELPYKIWMALAREGQQGHDAAQDAWHQADSVWATAPRPVRDYCADLAPPVTRP